MASFRLNCAHIRNCPPPAELAAAIEKYGLPESEEFGILSCSGNSQAVFATLVRKTVQSVQKLDAANKEVTAAPVEKVTLYPFAVKPAAERLEIYAGSAAGIEQIGTFLASALGLATSVEPVELDVAWAVGKLMKETKNCQLKSIRVKEFAHNSYICGPYAPKFLDSEHGKDFLEEHAELLTSAAVKFNVKTGKANVSLSPTGCFTYSCHEDCQQEVQGILRTLV